jgi:5-methyltetrahydrofolate--homocysteine methyltransferase
MADEDILGKIELNVIQGRRNIDDEGLDDDLFGTPGVTELVGDALSKGVGAEEILTKAITSGMTKVGDLYEEGTYFLPDMLTAAETVDAAMEILEPGLIEAGVEPKGKVILATVEGDLHDIGKNIVGLMLKGNGFEVIDLGNNVDTESITRCVVENEANLVGLSALLTTTMQNMGETIASLSEMGLSEKVKVMVGGAPITADFADKIGADGYGKDAFEAIRLAESYVAD